MFYLFDKPVGISSFDVIRTLRRLTGIKKMGHTGTLDPLASGLLLVATDNSTKLIPYLEWYDKTYIFTVRLDGTSASLDRGEPIVAIDTSRLSIPSDHEIIAFLEGLQTQVPPQYSALHIDGVRAYELARQGKSFTIPSRPVRIRNVRVTERGPESLTIEATISAGGYIRSLAREIGDLCGVSGGYISLLRRTCLHMDGALLREEDAQDLEHLHPERGLSLERLFPRWKKFSLPDLYATSLKNGICPPVPDDLDPEDTYFFYEARDGFLALIHKKNQQWKVAKNNLASSSPKLHTEDLIF